MLGMDRQDMRIFGGRTTIIIKIADLHGPENNTNPV
jgi:hypothetical protein